MKPSNMLIGVPLESSRFRGESLLLSSRNPDLRERQQTVADVTSIGGLGFRQCTDAASWFSRGAAAAPRRLDTTMARMIRAPPINMRKVGFSPNSSQAAVIPYTGSRAKTTAAVRALITARLATNRLWATAVQNTPSRPIHSQSIARTSASPGAATGNRHNATTTFWHNAACTAGIRPELARLFSDSRENSNPEAMPQS